MLGLYSLAASGTALVLFIVTAVAEPAKSLSDALAWGFIILALVGTVLGVLALVRKQGSKGSAIAGLVIGALLLIGVFGIGPFL